MAAHVAAGQTSQVSATGLGAGKAADNKGRVGAVEWIAVAKALNGLAIVASRLSSRGPGAQNAIPGAAC